jgi:hypothetical protein
MCHDDLTATVMAMESASCLIWEMFVTLWRAVFLKISPRVARVSAILEMSPPFSTCLDHSRSRLAVSCASLRQPTGGLHFVSERRRLSLDRHDYGVLCQRALSSRA